MSQIPQVNSAAPARKSRRLIALGIIVLILGGLITWDYLALRNHRTSLAQLQQAMQRAQTLQSSLRREEVSTLLVGSPAKRSKSGLASNLDYFTWHGLLHSFHICVVSNAAGDVMTVDDSELPEGNSIVDEKAPPDRWRVPEAAVEAALTRAEELYRKSGHKTKEFQETLRDVFKGLPEIKVSTVKGNLVWNSFEFPRRQRRLFAMRLEIPPGKPLDLDLVQCANLPAHIGLIAIDDDDPARAAAEVAQWRRWDGEQNVRIEGIRLPENNLVEFSSFPLRRVFDGTATDRFLLWAFTNDDDPDVPLEFQTMMFVSDRGAAPLRVGAHEVCEFIGLQTSIPKYPPTPDGVRSALTTLRERVEQGYHGPALIPRLLRPVAKALPMITASTTPGEANWQKLDLSHGPFAAVRVRIPESKDQPLMLFGATLSLVSGRLGWDLNALGEFTSHPVFNADQAEFPLSTPNWLTLLSLDEDYVRPGQEFIFWLTQSDAPQSPGPAFVTFSAIPLLDDDIKRGYPRITANRPWMCGKLLGIAVPKPGAVPNCDVLGVPELPIARLMFTPDSRRLLTADDIGSARIWNVASKELDGELTLPYGTAKSAVAGPDSETIWSVDNPGVGLLQWPINMRQVQQGPAVPLRRDDHLKMFGFASDPIRLVSVTTRFLRVDATVRVQSRFSVFDFANEQWMEPPENEPGEILSLVYLPSLKVFATLMRRSTVDAENSPHLITFVRIWSADLAQPLKDLPLSDLTELKVPTEFSEMRPASLSVSADGRRLAAACPQGWLKVWNIGTWDEVLSTSLPNSPLSVSLSADGETVATTESNDNTVTLWSVSDGQGRSAFQTDDATVTQVIHSPDGKWVATADADGVVRLWKTSPEDADSVRVARDVQPEQFIGKWSGKWNGQWKAQVTIRKNAGTGKFELVYEWEEHVGLPMQRAAPEVVEFKNDALISGNLEITLHADNLDTAKMIGKFQRTRTAILRRESR